MNALFAAAGFALVAVTPGFVFSQDLLEPVEPPQEEQPELEEVVVTGEREEKASHLGAISMQPVQVVPKAVLQRNARATLGETLGWEPGVSSGYFGPGSSRPVIRGFEGVRVRTLKDDLGTFDLSDVSPDHGVALEPFLLESVEIHRGPASLLYGNSAIGGAVNARSRVLARSHPAEAVSGGWETRYDTNGEAWAGAGHLTLSEGPWILRFTGSARDSNDISIPGRARSGAHEFVESPRVYDPGLGMEIPVPNASGTLPNSAHEGSTWSGGISWKPEDRPYLLGMSYSRFDSTYGVPYFYPGDPTDLFGDYSIQMAQDRFDFEGSADFENACISRIEGRLGYATYRHGEFFEGMGKDSGRDFLDTSLGKDAWEGRLDTHHKLLDGRLTGVVGITGGIEDLTAARTVFPPPGIQRARSQFHSESAGIYLLEKYEVGDWTWQIGHRTEAAKVTDESLEHLGFVRGSEDVSNSTSGGLTWNRKDVPWFDDMSLTAVLSRVERTPTATERYAFWNNAGIGRFLVGGDLDGVPLDQERSTGGELGLKVSKGPATLRVNGYYYDFSNFIFLQEAPGLTGGFGRAVQYIGREARFTGFESELEWRVREGLGLTLMSDYVHATNVTDDEPVPRMPPLRLGTRLEWQHGNFNAGVELRHAFAQDRVKPAPRAELPPGSYTMLNADASWKLSRAGQDVTFFIRATNLLNEEARVSTSFRKDTAPLPGRGLSLGIRHEF
ncbi:TonB-dependent receptor [Luteolibacter ambystomatis]|uniref:TonB-dependent receptor n=1 Tax=Luteolibacter ambystomatis TaxID=2824561 RepID=A0A975G4R5_9BACT|nr:TonB-dependent receptor [Luteolibacter ambystomatis]QUE49287.1 TonB-dependent receptor [Luteolibacter ambystomatis]